MVTPLMLQDGLNKFLEERIAGKLKFKSRDSYGVEYFKNPQVVSGFVIPKSIDEGIVDDIQEYPYIVTRIEKIENLKSSFECIVTVKILFGVYCPGSYDNEDRLIQDGSGYRDIWNLIEATRLELFEQLVIDNKYRIIGDFFEAKMPDEQPYPFWQGFCLTKWHVVYPMTHLHLDN